MLILDKIEAKLIIDKVEAKLNNLGPALGTTAHIPYYSFKYKNITAIGDCYHTTYDEEAVIKAFLDRKYMIKSDIKKLNSKLSQCLQVP